MSNFVFVAIIQLHPQSALVLPASVVVFLCKSSAIILNHFSLLTSHPRYNFNIITLSVVLYSVCVRYPLINVCTDCVFHIDTSASL